MNPRVLVIAAGGVVALAAAVAGWVALFDISQRWELEAGQPAFITFAGLSAPILGMAILRRHPQEWTGPLLTISVIAAMVAACRTTRLGDLSQVAGIVALVTVVLPALVAVTHPALQAPQSVRRAIMWCFWLTAGVGLLVSYLAATDNYVPRAWWFAPGGVGPAGPLAIAVFGVYSVAVMATATGVIVFALHRYWSMPLGGRSALRPLVLPLLAWMVSVGAATCWTLLDGITSPHWVSDAENTLFVILPAFLVCVLAAGIGWIDLMVRRPARSVLAARNEGLYHSRARETYVEQYLSRALADPTIRVLYPVVPLDGGWVEEWMDGNGQLVTPDVTSPDRAVTLIRRGSTLIGLIEQDAAAAARPDAVELVATGAGLMMETERLMAAARRDLEQSRLLATRLLSAADQPRAELRAQLLAGPLDGLDTAATDLAAGANLADIAVRLQTIAAQVRTISHGVFPPSLTSGGLRAAIPEADVPDHRYPAMVEMTAYLATRDDRSATIADTTTADGPALRITTELIPAATLRDRVAALGGSVEHTGARWSITVPATG